MCFTDYLVWFLFFSGILAQLIFYPHLSFCDKMLGFNAMLKVGPCLDVLFNISKTFILFVLVIVQGYKSLGT